MPLADGYYNVVIPKTMGAVMWSRIQTGNSRGLDAGLARRDDDRVVSCFMRWGVEFIHSQCMSIVATYYCDMRRVVKERDGAGHS